MKKNKTPVKSKRLGGVVKRALKGEVKNSKRSK